MEQKYQYNTVEEAIRDLQDGKIILVTDDPDRENEGDMICAAQFATQENINFMATHAKGLICTPMSAAVAERLGLPQQSLIFHRWFQKIPIIMKQHLRYRLIT